MHGTTCRGRSWVKGLARHIALPLLLLTLFAGCAAQSPLAATANRYDSGVGPQAGRSSFPQLQEAFPNQTVVPANSRSISPFGQQHSSASDRFFASLGNASDSIRGTFAFQPKRIPANDPVSLATEPPVVGADLHFHAGRVYEANQDFTRAMGHYEQALQTDPQDSRSMVALARTSDRAGDLGRAEAIYSQAAELRPQDAAILNDLGLCYAKQGKLDAAIEVLDRAVRESPNSVRYRNNLATILVNTGRSDAALQQLSSVHGTAVAHYNVGFLLSKRGEAELARRHLTLALQANPQLEPARQVLALLGGPVSNGPTATPNPQYRWTTPTQPVGFPQQHHTPMRSLPPL